MINKRVEEKVKCVCGAFFEAPLPNGRMYCRNCLVKAALDLGEANFEVTFPPPPEGESLAFKLGDIENLCEGKAEITPEVMEIFESMIPKDKPVNTYSLIFVTPSPMLEKQCVRCSGSGMAHNFGLSKITTCGVCQGTGRRD